MPSRSYIPETLALFAFGGFICLTCSLGSFQWQDAYVASLFDGMRGCQRCFWTIWFTRRAAYISAALVVVGAVIARRRGMSTAEIVHVLVWLGVSLLVIEGFKLVIVRDRPGGASFHTNPNSFPSGHVANAALCTAAAFRLLARRAGGWDLTRGAMTAVGTLFVSAVALTRVYMGLHWLSDVVASALLGFGFGAMLAARPAARRVLVGGTAAVLLPVLYLSAACGARFMLPSPATLGKVARGLPADERVQARSGGDVDLRIETEQTDAVLKVLGRPSRPLRGCPWLQLFVDDRAHQALPLEAGMRTYAFALPALDPGMHQMRLRLVSKPPPALPPGKPLLDLETLQIE